MGVMKYPLQNIHKDSTAPVFNKLLELFLKLFYNEILQIHLQN